MTPLTAPVRPWRGFRDTDSYGSGVFLASRDNGGRKHIGRDIITVPGDIIVAPFPALVARFGTPYVGSGLHLVELHGGADFHKWVTVLEYVRPSLNVGMKVDAGDPIGVAEDLTAYYRTLHPGHADITNHLHWEVTRPVDGGDLLPDELHRTGMHA